MCGRGVRPEGAELVEGLEAELVDEELSALPVRYNLAPTDPLGVLWRDEGRRRLSVASWGVPRRGGGIAINARDDRLRSSPWASLLRRGRVVVPLRGFYEWERLQRQPWYFHRRDGGLLLLAGLILGDGDGLHATIVTTGPSGDIGGIHDRMPAVLEPDMIAPWLEGEDPAMLVDLVRPAPEGTLLRYPVGKAVGNVRNDGPELVEPVEPVRPRPQQAELF
ncbi:MAG: SOS response-associated peptidase [Myxococcales bacterium]|nr:SOS response-associated peptidase [Myxococcales bacterium]